MISTSTRQTRDIGARLAQLLKPGDALMLYGDLGAGKSELTRGLAQGLGIPGPLPSPSFTILNVYDDGILPLYHFDWYRLESAEELYELGMDELLNGNGIAVVEWPTRCPEAVPVTHLAVTISPMADGSRELHFERKGGFHAVEGFA